MVVTWMATELLFKSCSLVQVYF